MSEMLKTMQKIDILQRKMLEDMGNSDLYINDIIKFNHDLMIMCQKLDAQCSYEKRNNNLKNNKNEL